MKLLILSDIHGNLDALHAIRELYDELWVLGDIVNYGPELREALEAVRATASIVVQGNHDHAVGHCDDCRWSARFREVAEATRRFTSRFSLLARNQRRARSRSAGADGTRNASQYQFFRLDLCQPMASAPPVGERRFR